MKQFAKVPSSEKKMGYGGDESSTVTSPCWRDIPRREKETRDVGMQFYDRVSKFRAIVRPPGRFTIVAVLADSPTCDAIAATAITAVVHCQVGSIAGGETVDSQQARWLQHAKPWQN